MKDLPSEPGGGGGLHFSGVRMTQGEDIDKNTTQNHLQKRPGPQEKTNWKENRTRKCHRGKAWKKGASANFKIKKKNPNSGTRGKKKKTLKSIQTTLPEKKLGGTVHNVRGGNRNAKRVFPGCFCGDDQARKTEEIQSFDKLTSGKRKRLDPVRRQGHQIGLKTATRPITRGNHHGQRRFNPQKRKWKKGRKTPSTSAPPRKSQVAEVIPEPVQSEGAKST